MNPWDIYYCGETCGYPVMNRRKFTLLLATSATAAVAGCGGGGGGSDADTSSPEAVVESYYRAANEVESDTSAEEAIETIRPFFYEGSPLFELIRASLEEDGVQETQNLENIETTVTDENLGTETLIDDRGLESSSLSEDEIEAIAEENALVETSVEYEDAQGGTQEHLTATTDGDWLIVF